MIFVTLGTQDKSFKRLLEDIDQLLKEKKIKDQVIVQAGFTKFKSDDMEIFDLVSKEDFDCYIKECDILITHGGVGSILTGLKYQKKVIACPRLAKYHEHINDHQVQIVTKFGEAGYILPYYDGDDLSLVLKKVSSFKPARYHSNTQKMIEIIQNFIDNH